MDSGLKDELVPPVHMTKLRDAAVNARFTSFHTIEGGGHNVSGSFFFRLKFDSYQQCYQFLNITNYCIVVILVEHMVGGWTCLPRSYETISRTS